MKAKKVFFNGLNELRFIASFAVVFHHIELFKFRDGYSSLFSLSPYFIENLGKNAVYLFFVLSGFLITYLLLQEKHQFKSISLVDFFLRRIYRIWPLYLLIMVISFCLIPLLAHNFDLFQRIPSYYNKIMDVENYQMKSILLYLSFLPNIALRLGYVVPGASQSWSIGVEEQFYILWPFLLMLVNRRLLPVVFIGIIMTPLINLFGVFDQKISFLIRAIPFEFLAMGVLGAYLYFYYNSIILRLSSNRNVTYLLYILVLLLMTIPIFPRILQNMVLGSLFVLLIFITIDDHNKLAIRSKSMSKIGLVSYGIYMFHPFVMFLIFPLVNKYISNNVIYNIAVYGLIVILTFVFSTISYNHMEKRLITIKNKRYKKV